MTQPLSVSKWPRAILHIDGDSFFASCEQARRPELKDKPIVVGKERGIATAMSIEAKQAGITRGMQMHKIKEICPEVQIIESDYEYYTLVSKRMLSVVRDYTPDVEAYSIDECFAEITGLRSAYNASYKQIAIDIKKELESDLAVTFSVGVASTKTTAKVASDDAKPAGCTCIPAKQIHRYLKDIPVDQIWGIGARTAHLLSTHDIETALEFAKKEKLWIQEHLAKPHQQIWQELRGKSCKPPQKESGPPKSITRSRTFSPPSTNPKELLSRLGTHAETACKKARSARMYTDTIAFFLKDQQFNTAGTKITLTHNTNSPHACMKAIRKHFFDVYKNNREYRSTGIRLLHLIPYKKLQKDLFSNHTQTQEARKLFETIDEINDTFGAHTITLARSQQTQADAGHTNNQSRAKNMQLPYLGRVH